MKRTHTHKFAETPKDRPSAIFGYIHAGGINSIFKPFSLRNTTVRIYRQFVYI